MSLYFLRGKHNMELLYGRRRPLVPTHTLRCPNTIIFTISRVSDYYKLPTCLQITRLHLQHAEQPIARLQDAVDTLPCTALQFKGLKFERTAEHRADQKYCLKTQTI